MPDIIYIQDEGEVKVNVKVISPLVITEWDKFREVMFGHTWKRIKSLQEYQVCEQPQLKTSTNKELL
jgi:hypothetical protein